MNDTENPTPPDAALPEDDDPTLDAAPAAAPPVAATGATETLEAVEEADQVDEAEEVEEAGEGDEADELEEAVPPPAAQAVTGSMKELAPPPLKSGRPDLVDRREPLYREVKGYTLRLDPPDLARLRELPGSRGRSDTEIGEAFFDGQGERLASAIADDVPTPSEVRVVVDPYSRQAFLALENQIRGILSF